MATVSYSPSPNHPGLSDALRWVRALAAPHRYRVIRDAEGWPVIPGRLGQIEYHDGVELAVYTDHPKMIAKLWAIPGVRRWQVGDQEARGLFPMVAGVIRARRKRPPSDPGKLRGVAVTAVSAA